VAPHEPGPDPFDPAAAARPVDCLDHFGRLIGARTAFIPNRRPTLRMVLAIVG
jgi:hypothetical protein